MEKGIHIFLIEDDEDDALLFGEAINEINSEAEVTNFSRWEDTKNFVRETGKRPRIIFIDYMLPGSTGLDFAHHVRQDEIMRDTPLVLFSGIAEHLSAKTGDFTHVISKPSNYEQLIATLRKVFRESIPELA